MTFRTFPAIQAVISMIAAALAYAIFEKFGQDWLAALFFVLAGVAGYQALGWVVETSGELIANWRIGQADARRAEVIGHDKTLLLAEQIARLDTDRLAVFRELAGAQFDPYDPASVVLPGFNLLTRAFAVSWFAASDGKPFSMRNYAEGRSDRQREQAGELIDWLVVEGYASRAAYNTPAAWAYDGAAADAIAALKL